MAKQIEEPRNGQCDITDWQKFISRTQEQAGGFICMGLTNLDNSGRPDIAAGSRFSIDRVVFYADKNETIQNPPPAGSVSGNWYIYAIPSGFECTFKFSRDIPKWNPEHGGWYKENTLERAIAKFFYTEGLYYNKVILDNYNAQSDIPDTQGVPVTIPDYEEGKPYSGEFDLAPGIYRYSVRGGDSGAGGSGGAGGTGGSGDNGPQGATGPTGAAGGAKNNSVAVTGVFIWHGGKIKVVVGANGGAGGAGGKGGNGAGATGGYGSSGSSGAKGGPGGGGGSGVDSYIGGIIGPGGKPTMGGNNNTEVTYYGNLQIAAPGSIGIGAPGLAGEGTNTNYRNAVSGSGGYGSPGTPGGNVSTSTSGHARLWRLGR
jgi:hypothetical protein